MAKAAKKDGSKEKELKEGELVVEAAPVETETTEKSEHEPEATTEDSDAAEAIEEPSEKKSAAKAGKRSTKGQAEAEAKAEKVEHQKHRKEEKADTEAEAKPKKAVKPTRPRLERQGKKFRDAAKLVEKDKVYDLEPALVLAQKTNPAKFDASVELHINLNVDPRHADQNIRDNVVLPAGTGKSVCIAVFDDGKVAGADISGVENIAKLLEKGELDFDILIATPAQMPKLSKYARVLGPRGLMPNPKSGTVTTDVAKAVKEAKSGRVEYRVDSTGIVHLSIGKVSFTSKQLLENAQAVMSSIKSNKPSSIKGVYVKSIHISTSMGPSITVNPNAN